MGLRFPHVWFPGLDDDWSRDRCRRIHQASDGQRNARQRRR
jgi:hypothetical protein